MDNYVYREPTLIVDAILNEMDIAKEHQEYYKIDSQNITTKDAIQDYLINGTDFQSIYDLLKYIKKNKLVIPNNILANARKRADKLEHELYEQSNKFYSEYRIEFTPNGKPSQDNNHTLTYDINLLQNIKTTEHLFYALIFGLGMINQSFIIPMSIKEKDPPLTDLFILKRTGCYNQSSVSKTNQDLIFQTFFLTLKTLKTFDIALEEHVITGFEDLLSSKFGINSFKFKNRLSGDFYYKCICTIINIESLAKAYMSYVANGTIDTYYTSSLSNFNFEDTKSILPQKYIKLKANDDLKTALDILYSSNSVIYLTRTSDVKSNFDLFTYNSITEDEINDIYKDVITTLKSHNLVCIDLENFIRPTQWGYHLYTLWANEYFLYDLNIKTLLASEQIEFQEIQLENGLFCEIEKDYIKFLLRDKYGDSLGIRNQYLHGDANFFANTTDENNYYILLYFLVILESKILMDLATYNSLDNESFKNLFNQEKPH